MRFCAIFGYHPDDRPGGAELQARFITEELADRGHDAHYIAYDVGYDDRSDQNGVTVHRLDTESTLTVTSPVRRRVREIDPDVCYCRNIGDIVTLAVIQATCDAHTVFNISHDAQCRPLFAAWPGKENKTGFHTLFRRGRLACRRGLLVVPDTRFSQTSQQTEQLAANRGLESTLVGNGHPVPEDHPDKSNPPVVLWLASIKEWKQPDVFVEVAKRCMDLECTFRIVGQPTDEQLADRIRETTSDLPNVEYEGGCDVAESNDYIADATVFVNTSTQEGFPNTFLQSWLRETAVVSLHADPENLLTETGLGRHAGGSTDRLVSAVRTLVTDEEERNTVCDRARDYAVEHHSIRSVVDSVERALPVET